MTLQRREKCDICGSSQNLKVLLSLPYSNEKISSILVERYHGNLRREDIAGGYFELARCYDCHHAFQTYIPSEDLSQRIYNYPPGRIDKSFKKRTQASFSHFAHNSLLVEKMGCLLGGEPYKKSVLDFGMGWGAFIFMSKAFGYNVCGLEVSKERLDYAGEMAIPYVRDLSQLAGRQFHFINVDSTFEHVSDPLGLLVALKPFMRDDGIIFISVPNGNNILSRINATRRNPFEKLTYPLEHINCFSHKSLVRLAEKAGLRSLTRMEIANRLLAPVRLTRNAHLLQAALGEIWKQGKSTELYFIKK